MTTATATAPKTKLNLTSRQREFYKLIQQHGPATLEQLTALYRQQYGKPKYHETHAKGILEAMATETVNYFGDNSFALSKTDGIYSIRPEDERQEMVAQGEIYAAKWRKEFKVKEEQRQQNNDALNDCLNIQGYWGLSRFDFMHFYHEYNVDVYQPLVCDLPTAEEIASVRRLDAIDTEWNTLDTEAIEALEVALLSPSYEKAPESAASEPVSEPVSEPLSEPKPVAKPVAQPKAKAKTSYRRGQNHGRAKLTATQVEQVWSMLASGVTQAKIAAAVGVSRATIAHIKTKRIWAHLTNTLPSLSN